MSDRVSRRRFLTSIAATGLSADVALGSRWRRVPCQPVCVCPPSLGMNTGLRIRQNITSLSGPQIDSLRRAVAAMKNLPASQAW